MEVINQEFAPSSPDQILVLSQREGTSVVGLICDNVSNGYFVNHWNKGKQICYEYAGDNFPDAAYTYYQYLEFIKENDVSN